MRIDVLLAMLALPCASFAQLGEAVPRGALVAAWVSPAFSNDSIARDLSASGNTLVCSGGVSFVSAAYTFDGSNDFLYRQTNDFLGVAASNGTIVARVMLTAPTTTTFRAFASCSETEVNSYCYFQIASGNLMYGGRYGVSPDNFVQGSVATNALRTNVWYTVAVTVSPAIAQLSIDALPIAQTTNVAVPRWIGSITNRNNIAVANLRRTTDNISPGAMSALLVFDRALTAAELSRLHLYLNSGGLLP